ncbi:hypothetical protein NE236_36870 [Actinoallomurus purpureus]|uniref:hypothetical protein n=1 Tax=Actinoallomurus purpureus TaxID=478114 RepID=UPI0020939F51|nr:hypothetical protein [Actinoallomurus purpureus]MCO6010546.1 hypothetical protein [Actinoallomurus purpureus]
MALGVEFASVIVRTADADRTLPGGLDEFAPTQPNYIEDEHLFRVGFMSTREADELIDHLLSLGLPGKAVTAEQMNKPLPPWLQRDEVNGLRAVWLAGENRGELVPPLQSILLRGPLRLRDTITSMHADGEISIRRMPPGEHGNDRLEIAQADALVDLDILQTADSDTIALQAIRRQERNRHCRADIELLKWLKTALHNAA